jgi:hypothetical protein
MRKSITLLFVLVIASFILFGCTSLDTNCPDGEIPVGGVCSTASELIDSGEDFVDFVMPTQEEIQTIQDENPINIEDEANADEQEIEDLVDELTPEGMIETKGVEKVSKLSFAGTTPQIPFTKTITNQSMTTTIDLEAIVNVTNFSGKWSDYKSGCRAKIETSTDGTNWNLIADNIGIATDVAIPHASKIKGEMQYIRFTKKSCTTPADILSANIFGDLVRNPLIAYYKFENNTDDSSGREKHAENNSVTFTEGLNGKAASFDGTSYTHTKNLDADLSEEYTLSAWVKSNKLGSASFVLELLWGQPLLLIKENKPYVTMFDGDEKKWKAYSPNDLYIADNQWNHIAATYHKDDTITLYVNGVASIAGKHDDKIGSYPKTPEFKMGGRNTAMYQGLLDEVKIYDVALSSTQVNALYNENKPTAIIDDAKTNTVTNGLLAHYRFENNSLDTSGNNAHAINNGVLFVDDGVKGNAGRFNNNAYIYRRNVTNGQQLDEEITFTGWFKADSYPGTSFPLEIGWGKPVLQFNDTYGISGVFRNQEDTLWNYYNASGSKLIENEWNFVALTYSADDAITIYLNDTKYDAGTHAGFIGAAPNNPTFIMGGRANRWFNGLIDEVRIYNRALSEGEIFQIYAPTDTVLSGDGTNTSPYKISSCKELEKIFLNAETRKAQYILEKDIDCSDTKNWNYGAGFTSSTTPDQYFLGVFDGQNFKISNLYINQPNANNIGLFSKTNNAIIKNINLVNYDITGHTHVGSLVGSALTSTITNIIANGKINGHTNVGGIIGYSDTGNISNNQITGTINGKNQVGALIGNSKNGNLLNNISHADVTGENNVGGFVGHINIQKVDDHKLIFKNNYSTGQVIGNKYVGGQIGYINNYSHAIRYSHLPATITQNSNTGDTIGNAIVGGLIGYIKNLAISFKPPTVSRNFTSGNTNGRTYVGGLIGFMNNGIVIDNYTTGDTNGIDIVGGLVGKTESVITERNYSIGKTTASSRLGGIGGTIVNSEKTTNNYSAGIIIGKSNVGGIYGYSFSSSSDNYTTYDAIGFSHYPGTDQINVPVESFFGSNGLPFTELGFSTSVWTPQENNHPILAWEN